MKRYSVSVAYGRDRKNGKVNFHYYGRTDNVEETIARYRKGLEYWISAITNEGHEYRDIMNDYKGIRITDSQTKKVVFEESHVAEEYGYKMVFTLVKGEYGSFNKGEWIKL